MTKIQMLTIIKLNKNNNIKKKNNNKMIKRIICETNKMKQIIKHS